MNGEKKKILLVEDEVNLREVTEYRLKEAGYEVITAPDGFFAISLAQRENPNLILLDLMLPKLDGYAVCRMLRLNESTKNIPIIMLTARTAPQDRDRGIEMGANLYLTKPVDIPLLLQKISELLQGKKVETGEEITPGPSPEKEPVILSNAADKEGIQEVGQKPDKIKKSESLFFFSSIFSLFNR